MSTDGQNPKKRKIEEGKMPTHAEVAGLLELWTQDQLLDVLSQLGSQSPEVLAAIHLENDKDPKQRKLFVRNLSFETDSDALHRIFSTYGSVQEAVVIKNKGTQQSKGFGFVTFETSAAAATAISPGSVEIDGRTAYVSLAAAKRGPPTNQGGAPGQGSSGEADTAQTKLFVRQLDYKTSSESLATAFAEYGAVKEAVVLQNNATGQSKGYGFVTFETVQGAQAALASGGTKQIDGRTTYFKLAVDREGSGASQQRTSFGMNQNQMAYIQQLQRMRQMGGGQQQFQGSSQTGYGQAQQGYGHTPSYGQSSRQQTPQQPQGYNMWSQQYSPGF